MRSLLLCAGLLAGLVATSQAGTIGDSLRTIQSSPDYVEIVESPGIHIDLRYATANNFVGRNLYGEFNRAYLHRIAAEKLKQAANNLQRAHPGYRLIIFDALRPRSVQVILWDQVRGSDKETYVANPKGGSIHNFGLAVDLSVQDAQGRELDMGTPYDDFTALSQPQQEARFLKEGRLSLAQIQNRRILRSAMEQAGFIQLPVEWWHFDALPKAEVRSQYKIVE